MYESNNDKKIMDWRKHIIREENGEGLDIRIRSDIFIK